MSAQKLAYSVAEVSATTGMTRNAVYDLIKSGELVSYKPTGSKQIVTHKHLMEFFDRLEQADVTEQVAS